MHRRYYQNEFYITRSLLFLPFILLYKNINYVKISDKRMVTYDVLYIFRLTKKCKSSWMFYCRCMRLLEFILNHILCMFLLFVCLLRLHFFFYSTFFIIELPYLFTLSETKTLSLLYFICIL